MFAKTLTLSSYIRAFIRIKIQINCGFDYSL